MAQELGDFRLTQLPRVALSVIQNETPDPLDVGLFGTDRVMANPDRGANLIQKPWRRLGFDCCRQE